MTFVFSSTTTRPLQPSRHQEGKNVMFIKRQRKPNNDYSKSNELFEVWKQHVTVLIRVVKIQI